MRIDELFLSEKRKNPHLNVKLTPLEQLAKYKGQKDVFVSYTQDVGVASHFPNNKSDATTRHVTGVRASHQMHNTRGSKLGINPRSEYKTPIGIYAYPVDYVLMKEGDVEFAGNSPYMYVFRAEGHFFDVDNYTEEDFERDLKKIKSLNPSHEAIRAGIKEADPDTPAGRIWNVMRHVSSEWADELNGAYMDDEPYEDEFDTYEEYEEAYADWESDKARTRAALPQVQWSILLRKLGYDGAIDFNTRGGWTQAKGVLHENEPVQAVFLTKKNVKVLEVIYNRTQRNALTQQQIWSSRPDIFVNMLAKGRISTEEAVEFLKSNIHMFGQLKFSQFPKPLQDYLQTHYEEFIEHDYNNDFLKKVPLSSEALIKIISKDGWRANGVRLPPAVQKWVIDHFDKMSKYVGILRLPDKVIIEKMKQDPQIAYLLPSDVQKVSPAVQSAILDINPKRFVDYFQTLAYKTVRPEIAAKFLKWIMKSEYKRNWDTVVDKAWDGASYNDPNCARQLAAYLQILPARVVKKYLDAYRFDFWDKNNRFHKSFLVAMKARPDMLQYYPKPQKSG
jgi:hypothetical protein